MVPLLNNGIHLTSRSNNEYRIDKYLTHGGQGEIYLDESGARPRVIKSYYSNWATPLQKKILIRLIELDPPSPHFVWPLDFLRFDDINSFGFVMSYVDMEKYLSLENKRYEDSGTNFFRDITSAILLADSFFRLHIRGLCYADINGSNILFDINNGNVKILDTDNIIFNGEEGLVGGTLSFKAPELIRGETIYPSADTDRYSLSIALFLLLFRNHPLNGKKFTDLPFVEAEQMEELYGRNPIFIYDPKNDENRPDDPEEHRVVNILWNVYPDYIRNLMITAFTQGLNDPHKRVREMKWRSALMKLRDSITKCPSCGTENFYPIDDSEPNISCWNCGNTIFPPPRLKITGPGFKRIIVLNEGSPLCKGHIDNSYNIRERIGLVEVNTSNKLGLKNRSSETWNYKVNAGSLKPLTKDRGVLVSDRVTIEFTKKVSGNFIISKKT